MQRGNFRVICRQRFLILLDWLKQRTQIIQARFLLGIGSFFLILGAVRSFDKGFSIDKVMWLGYRLNFFGSLFSRFRIIDCINHYLTTSLPIQSYVCIVEKLLIHFCIKLVFISWHQHDFWCFSIYSLLFCHRLQIILELLIVDLTVLTCHVQIEIVVNFGNFLNTEEGSLQVDIRHTFPIQILLLISDKAQNFMQPYLKKTPDQIIDTMFCL